MGPSPATTVMLLKVFKGADGPMESHLRILLLIKAEAVDEPEPADDKSEMGRTSSHTMSPPSATAANQNEVDEYIVDVALTQIYRMK